MIYTSYFAKIKKFPENVIPIAITAVVPDWYTGLSFTWLAPKYDILAKYKNDHDETAYTECFNNTILNRLNSLWVLEYLRRLIEQDALDVPFWDNPDVHVALICYEKPSDFCHRHLVSEWLRNHGFECREWEEENSHEHEH